MPRQVNGAAVQMRTPGRNARAPNTRCESARRDRSASVHDQEWNEDRAAPEGYDPDEDLLHMEIPPPIATYTDGNETRLIITRIELENFKSFYGHQVIGPLHKNFTAIIGPNGSGKSNVIDSLLFVFGYRSAKLRSKKLGSLIHNSKHELNKCTVTVYMQKFAKKGANWEPIEGTEISFSRSAFKNNSSQYRLNGNDANFSEVTAKLRAAGVDIVHNRFLILQGEVEQISQLRPKATAQGEEGMLEYLEDIIGSNRLKAPIEKINFKLSLIENERSKQAGRISHVEREKKELETPARKAIDQLRIVNAIALLTNKIQCARRYQLSKRVEELGPERDIYRTHLEEAQETTAKIAGRMKEFKLKKETLQSEFGKRQDALNTAETQLRNKEGRLIKVKCDQEKLAEQRRKIGESIKSEEEKLEDLATLPQRAQAKIEELKVDREQAEQVIEQNSAQVERNLPVLTSRTATFTEEKRELEAQIGEHTPQEDKISQDLVLAQTELANLMRDEETQKNKKNELLGRLTTLEEEYENKSRSLNEGKQRLPRLEAELRRAQDESASLEHRETELLEETKELQITLEQNKRSAEAIRSSSEILTALMREKNERRIPGIYGRLGDLGGIDEKYEVAIINATGLLDHVVVDTVETAQLCIQFLKRNSLGQASFILLDKQQHLWEAIKRRKPNFPENMPRLFDLIRVEDEKVLPAFYMGVMDTLVAPDIITANRIALGAKRWRVVTLKGELIDPSGSMTGGGVTARRGKIGRNVAVNTSEQARAEANNLRQMQERLDLSREELKEVRRMLSELRVEASRRREEFNRLDRALSAAEKIDLKTLSEKIAAVKKAIETQEEKLQASLADPAQVQREQKNIDRLAKERGILAEKGDEMRVKLMDLNTKIDAITEEIIGPYQKSLHEAEEQRKKADEAITKQKSAISTNDKNIEKANRQKRNFEEDLKRTEKKMQGLEQEQEELEKSIDELRSSRENRHGEVTDLETAHREMGEEETRLSSEEFDAQQRTKKLQEDLRGIEAKITSIEAKMKEARKEISKLKIFWFGDAIQLPQAEKGGGDAGQREDDEAETLIQHELACLEALDAEQMQRARTSTAGAGEPMEVDDESELDDDDEEEQQHQASFNMGEGSAARRASLGAPTLEDFKRPVPVFATSTISTFDVESLEEDRSKLERLNLTRKEKPNLRLLLDYMEKVRRYEREYAALQAILHERDLHRECCENLRKKRLQEFMDGYQKINDNLKEMYQMITLGGDASLDLVNSLDPFTDGISFGVRPPKKSWKQIANLSGGEKTLASLALILGLHHYRPSPFYVMDEIDAALDYRNVSIVSHLIKERTQNAQFLIISLRNNMFEKGDRIVGIYKVDDCTRNIVVDNNVEKLVAASS